MTDWRLCTLPRSIAPGWKPCLSHHAFNAKDGIRTEIRGSFGGTQTNALAEAESKMRVLDLEEPALRGQSDLHGTRCLEALLHQSLLVLRFESAGLLQEATMAFDKSPC